MSANSAILPVLSVIAGLVFGVAAIYLLATQRFVKGDSGTVEVEIPLFGRIKTNYPAAGALFGGIFLIWYPQYHASTTAPECPKEAAPFTVKGKIKREGKDTSDGIVVGVIPGTIVPTDSEGSYSLSVKRVPGSYMAVAYIPNDPTTPYVKSLDLGNDPVTFDHEFGKPHGAVGPPPGN
jgi:hypothetical protein